MGESFQLVFSKGLWDDQVTGPHALPDPDWGRASYQEVREGIKILLSLPLASLCFLTCKMAGPFAHP